MYTLKFKDHVNNATTRRTFEKFEDACSAMTEEWEDHANGFVGGRGFLEDMEAERDADEWRCYREWGDGEAHAVLEHLDSDHGPDYEWDVRESPKVLFELKVTEDDLAEWLGEMYAEEGFDDVEFRKNLNKVCAAASVDCGGHTALTDWLWGHVSYDYIMDELEDAVKEYMASTIRREE